MYVLALDMYLIYKVPVISILVAMNVMSIIISTYSMHEFNYSIAIAIVLGPPAAKKVHFFLAFPSTFLVKLGGFHIFVLTYASPRSPLRAEYFGTRIGPVR